jgi:Ribonuclease G/E
MGRQSNLEVAATAQLENLTEEIRKVSQLGKAINNSKLTRRAVCLLLSEMSGVKRSDIDVILHNLPLLEKQYLKP